MFGINTITWPEFLRFICLGLGAWYLLIFVLAWIRTKQNTPARNFEDAHSENPGSDQWQPIAISSMNYPSEILPVNPVDNQSLEASLYEETGMDEGVALDYFVLKNSPVLASMIDDFHHQQ